MKECKKIEKLIEKSLSGDISASEENILNEHLTSCETCSKDYSELKSTLELMQKNNERELEEQFMDNFWETLEPNLQKEKSFVSILKENLNDLLRFRTGWKYQLAAGLTVLFIGIFIGKYFTSGNPDMINHNNPVVLSAADLKAETNDYIQRSKMLLMGISNFDPATEDIETISFPRQQRISRDLIKQASFIKSKLNEPQQQQLKRLVSDIEIILLQIANMETQMDLDGIELVKDGVDSKGLIMKINLEEIRENLSKSPKHNQSSDNKENKNI